MRRKYSRHRGGQNPIDKYCRYHRGRPLQTLEVRRLICPLACQDTHIDMVRSGGRNPACRAQFEPIGSGAPGIDFIENIPGSIRIDRIVRTKVPAVIKAKEFKRNDLPRFNTHGQPRQYFKPRGLLVWKRTLFFHVSAIQPITCTSCLPKRPFQ